MNNPKIHVAHLGARRHYAEAEIFNAVGFLDCFYTDAYIGNKPLLKFLLRVIPSNLKPKILQRLLSRENKNLSNEKVRSFDFLGFWYTNALRKAKNQEDIERIYCEGARRFARKIFSHGLRNCNLLWGYNGASLELFEHAKSKGIRCVLDQTSNPKPHEIKLTNEEFRKWHEWIPKNSRYTPERMLEKREAVEWKLADAVIAGSHFVKSGLIDCGIPENRIHIIPSGIDLNSFKIQPRISYDGSRPLRVLFVGRVSVMKGIPYLLQALKQIGPQLVDARLVGPVSINREKLDEFSDVITIVGQVSRSEISEQYRWADVFCFPSITEGSATVTYEALASGIPVITTPNAGSMVRDGLDGQIVSICDPEGISDALHRYIQNPQLLLEHHKEAIAGRERLGLERYKSDLIDLIRKLH